MTTTYDVIKIFAIPYTAFVSQNIYLPSKLFRLELCISGLIAGAIIQSLPLGARLVLGIFHSYSQAITCKGYVSCLCQTALLMDVRI